MGEPSSATEPGRDIASEPILVADQRETGRWELDTSDARPLIEGIVAGHAPSSFWVDAMLASTRVVGVNPQVERRVGSYFGLGGMLGKPVGNFWPSESRTDLAEMIVEIGADPSPGTRRTRSISSLLLRDALLTISRAEAHGANILFVEIEGFARDGRSNWALRASEERYRKLMHHLPFALLQVDGRAMGSVYEQMHSDGVEDAEAFLDDHPELMAVARETVRITEVNRSAATLLGADGAEFVGPISVLFEASPDTPRRIMIARYEGRRIHSETMKLRTRDGRLLDVRLSVTFPAPPEQTDITIISLEDVTEQLRMEAQIRQLQTEFARAARISTLGELATSIAHEVNQPLAAIRTNAETSLRWLDRENPNLEKVNQLTSRIAASAQRASEIVQRIRGMAAKPTLECLPLNINEVIEEALLFVRHDLESRSIDLSTELIAGLPDVQGDRIQLQQVIVNLLVNSIQAIAQSGVEQGRIEVVTAADPGDGVILFVRDNGPGIADENLDRIFDGFFTTKEGGVGIGLAVCHSIVAAHRGEIAASNNPHGGACFRLRFPSGAHA